VNATAGAVATATLASLVAVGTTRRLLEVHAVRRGSAAPLGPATRTASGSGGGLADAVASWQPAPPRTATGRMATAAWAGPLTTLGALLAGAGGARPAWDPRRGCWVATGVRGPSAVLLRGLGLQANAIGHVVVVVTDHPSDRLLDHEAVHVRQFERLGPLLPLLYAWFSARHGYRENPLERAARRGAARTA
jgi:hypothetical protein